MRSQKKYVWGWQELFETGRRGLIGYISWLGEHYIKIIPRKSRAYNKFICSWKCSVTFIISRCTNYRSLVGNYFGVFHYNCRGYFPNFKFCFLFRYPFIRKSQLSKERTNCVRDIKLFVHSIYISGAQNYKLFII